MIKSSKENSNVKETWKDIKGYEGLYQVSDRGRVKSLGRTIIYKTGRKRYQKERILKPKTERNGYLRVSLFKDSNGKTLLVHRLVCEAFHENHKSKPPS